MTALSETKVRAYLQRLACPSPINGKLPEATKELFDTLHLAHLQTIPFENLDIALGKTISLEAEHVFQKLVSDSRGGFCYELNYAFSLLLSALGFKCTLLSARVFNGKQYGPEFDHLLLMVEYDSQHWVADVGFGDCFRRPLLLHSVDACSQNPQLKNRDGSYEGYKIFSDTDGKFTLKKKVPDQDWVPEYQFEIIERTITDFLAMCEYQQTSECSHFTQKSVCSIATATGRKSLSGDKLIVTEMNQKQTFSVADKDEYKALLTSIFQIVLPSDESIATLFNTSNRQS